MAKYKNDIFKILKKGTNEELIALLEDSTEQLDRRSGFWSNREPVLHYAAYHSTTDKVKTLIRFGVPLNALNDDKENALHVASMNNQTENAQVLLEAGIDYNHKNKYGRTTWHYSKSKQFKQTVTDFRTKDIIQKDLEKRQADKARQQAYKESLGRFVMDSTYIVSITELAEQTKRTFITSYNFDDETITREVIGESGPSCFMESFEKASSPNRLQKAKDFYASQQAQQETAQQQLKQKPIQ